MEVAQWWIMEMKPNHFEKARKIISLIWLSYNTVNIRTVLSSVPLVTAKSDLRTLTFKVASGKAVQLTCFVMCRTHCAL